jgi:hypothetical protein
MQSSPPSLWQRTQDYAGKVEEFVDAPVYDAAAVFGFDAVWLSGMLLAVKFITLGIGFELKKSRPSRG